MASPLSNLLDSFSIPRPSGRSVWSFFREAALRHHRRIAGTLPRLSHVLAAGEQLEQRRFFAVDVSLVGTVLSVTFDDTADDAISISINATGYTTSGANVTSGIGAITELVVTDAGTTNPSNLTLLDAAQVLRDGVDIGANVTAATITTDINATGGDVTIDSTTLTLSGNITAANQSFLGSVVLSGDATLTALNKSEFVPNFASPFSVGSNNTPGSARASVLSPDGRYAYLADSESGLQILDVSNAAGPTVVGSYDTSGSAIGITLSADGSYAFIADGTSGLQIINVSDPTNPSLAGNIDTPATAQGVALSSDSKIAYVADGTSGLQVINVADVGNLSILGNYDTPSNAKAVTISSDGAYAFIADSYYGLQIIDVVDPTAPFRAGMYNNCLTATDVTLSASNPYAFVAATSGLVVINVANIAMPTLEGSRFLGRSEGVSLTADESFAYVSTSEGLLAVNVSNPASPAIGGFSSLLAPGKGVTLASTDVYAYVSVSTSGLQIFQLGTLLTTPTTITFDGTVDGQFALTANGTSATFNGTVGSTSPLASLTTTANTTAIIAGGTIETAGNQTYGGVVNLAADAELIGDTGSFATGVEGNTNSLTLNFTGETAIGSDFANLTDLTSIGDVATDGTITTLNDQTYLANVTLAGDTTLTGNDVTFTSGVIGAGNDLTLNFAQTIAIEGIAGVGNLTSVGNVTLAGTVATIGGQNYQADATLAAATTIEGTTANFSGGLTGNGQDLSLNLTGGVVLDSQIDGVANLTAISDVVINGTVTTTGSQTYQAGATLLGDSTLTGSSGTFAAGVTGDGNDLTLNFAATTAIDGNFTGIGNLTSLGDVSLEGNITTTGPQNYAGTATLIGDAVLSSCGTSVFVPNYAAPTLAGSLDTSGRAYGVAVSTDGRYAFIADDTAGLQIINVSDVAAPALAGNVAVSGSSIGVAISTDGRGAFIANDPTGLQTINVSDVAAPALAGNLGTTSNAHAVVLSSNGQYAFVAAGSSSGLPSGLQIIDVSDIAAPSLVGNLTGIGSGYGVALSSDGGYAFVASYYYGLQIIDVSNVSNPTLAGTYDTSGFSWGVTLSSDGRYAFVADYYGLVIVDVSNVAAPTFAGNLTTPGQAFGVALSSDGQHAFVADYGGGLQIIDVSNVANPTPAGNYDTSGLARGVTLSSDGRYAFIADSASGLQIISLGSVTTTPGSITFGSTVDGQFSLTANASSATFNSTVGNATPLASLTTTTNTTAIIAGGTIETTGNQTYGGVVNLAADAELIGDTGSCAAGIEGNTNSLTLNFTNETTLVGDFVNLTNLTSIGDVATDGTITTLNDQTYLANVTLAGDTTLTGNDVTFTSGVIGGGNDLTLNFAQTTAIDSGIAGVGNLTSLGNVTLAGTVATIGAQDYQADATLTAATTIQGTTASFSGGVTGNGQDLSLNLSGGAVIDSQITGVANLTAISDISINGTVTTTGSQTYQANATLLGDSTLTGTQGTFATGVTGDGHDLTLNFAATTAIDGTFTGITNLTSLGNVTLEGTITTIGEQNYAATTTLLADTVVAVGQGSFTPDFGNMSVTDTVGTGYYAQGVAISSNGRYAFVAAGYYGLRIVDVTDPTNLTVVSTESGENSDAFSVSLSPDEQYAFLADEYYGLVIINVSDVNNPTLVSSLQFGGSGALDVALSPDGQTAYVIADNANLAAVDVSNVAQPSELSSLALPGGGTSVAVSPDGRYVFAGEGYPTYIFQIADVQNAASLTPVSNLSLGHIPYSITLSSTGQYAFASQDNYGIQIINVADVAVPANVSVISGRSDSSAVSRDDRYLFSVGLSRLTVYDVIDVANPAAVGNIAEGYARTGVALSPDGQYAYTTGDYGLAAISLGVSTPGGLARATFGGTVNGAFHLTVDDGLNGTTFFNGEVGGSTPLASLTTKTGGITTISGGSITTAGNQTYGDVVNLAADAELIGDTGSFAAGVEGNTNSLTLNFTNETTLVGDFANLTNLTSIGDVATDGTITTLNNQTYLANFTLAGDTTLTGNTGSFAQPIVGDGHDLSLNFTGETQLDGASNLGNLSSVGPVALNQTIETAGNQTYSAAVSLLGDTTLIGNTASFGSGVTGAGNSLTLNFTGSTDIGSTFTGIDDLTVTGPAALAGTIATTGNQAYQSAASLAGNTTLTSGAGAISTAGVADGGEGFSLTVGDANQTGGVTLGGNLSFGELASGAGAFAVTLSGANNSLASASLLNTGNLSIGTSAASQTFATNGFTAPTAATSFLAGTITTDSGVITLNATSLTANAVLDSTNGGVSNGAAIMLANGTQLNGFRLETFGGQSDTEVTGDTVVSDGEFIVETGSLNLGTPSQPGTLTATQDSLILVSNGAFNVFNGSTIAAGNNALTIQTNALQVDSGAGNITAGSLTLLPATNGTNIFLGSATGAGLEISQNAFNVFRTPLITIGEAGYNGTVDVGNLVVPEGRLDIIANGTGGTVLFDGDFDSTATGVPDGIGLFVQGSGATTTINGTITSAGAVVIDDAIVADGNHTIDTSSTNANITITGGTAGIYGAANQTNSLTINAGNGAVILGNQTGFSDNSGTGALLEDVTISAGSTLLGASPGVVNGTFTVLSGTVTLTGGTLTASEIDFTTNQAVVIDSAGGATLQSSGDLFIGGTLDGTALSSVQLLATDNVTVRGAIGETDAFGFLTVNSNRLFLSNNVTVTQTASYSGTLVLEAPVTFQALTGSLGAIEGNGYDFATNFSIFSSLGASGGEFANLASFESRGAGGTFSNVTAIESVGPVSFAGPVILLTDSTWSGTDLTLANGLNAGFFDLTLNFTESTAINGSDFSSLGNLTSLGPVALSGQIDSAGFQNYAAAATLSADTTLNATGNIDFGSLVDGPRQLNILSGGNVNLFAALGSTTPLQGLNLASAAAVTALGTLAIDGTGGTGAGLRIGDGVNNVNIAQPGSTITAATASGILLAGNTTGSTIGGFTITNSGSHGIEAAGGDYTGTTIENSSVTASIGDGFHAANATGLTGTLLHSADNAKAGVRVAGTSSNVTISNSLVGLDANGTAAQPNLGQGIVVSAATGTTLQGNTISGNGFYGIVVTGSAANTTISTNLIGVGTDGTTAIANGQSGVFVLGGATGTTIVGNRISNNSGMAGIQVVDGTSNTTIGGSGPNANLLVGNGLFGITVSGNVPGSRVLGNLVSSHTTANLYLNNAQNLTVGSATAGEENTFDTADYGVYAGGDLTGTTIQGNTFQQHTLGGVVLTEAGNLTVRDNTLDDNGAYGIYGTGELAGTTLQGNTISNHTVGVLVDNGANLTIGSGTGTSTSDPDANVITKNTSAGIVVNGAGSQNVSILSNSIFENDFIGISLSAGGNALARTPSLATATTTDVTGSITGTNGDVFRIQYFKSSDAVTSSSRFAQGEELLGYEDVTIVGGTAALAFDLSSSSVIVTDWITATATLLVGGLPSETSQFSFGIRVTA